MKKRRTDTDRLDWIVKERVCICYDEKIWSIWWGNKKRLCVCAEDRHGSLIDFAMDQEADNE